MEIRLKHYKQNDNDDIPSSMIELIIRTNDFSFTTEITEPRLTYPMGGAWVDEDLIYDLEQVVKKLKQQNEKIIKQESIQKSKT